MIHMLYYTDVDSFIAMILMLYDTRAWYQRLYRHDTHIKCYDTNDFIAMIGVMILIVNTMIQEHDTNDFIGKILIFNAMIQECDTNDLI